MTTLRATASLLLFSSTCQLQLTFRGEELPLTGAKECVPLSHQSLALVVSPVLSDLLQVCCLSYGLLEGMIP